MFSLNKLPKLLYIGDTPIENTASGMVLLYRLLQEYPPEKLFIIQNQESPLEKRLEGVTYRIIDKMISRVMRSRLHTPAAFVVFFLTDILCRRVGKLCGDFKPEVIVTVSHELSWLIAAKLAQRLEIPLVIICHDSLTQTLKFSSFFNSLLEKRFAEV